MTLDTAMDNLFDHETDDRENPPIGRPRYSMDDAKEKDLIIVEMHGGFYCHTVGGEFSTFIRDWHLEKAIDFAKSYRKEHPEVEIWYTRTTYPLYDEPQVEFTRFFDKFVG